MNSKRMLKQTIKYMVIKSTVYPECSTMELVEQNPIPIMMKTRHIFKGDLRPVASFIAHFRPHQLRKQKQLPNQGEKNQVRKRNNEESRSTLCKKQLHNFQDNRTKKAKEK